MSLLTNTQIANLTGTMGSHFDTFSRAITVYKESKKEVNTSAEADVSLDFLFGYGDDQPNLQDNYTYTEVKQSFNAIIRYGTDQEADLLDDVNIRYPDGKVRIKVELDCYNYIEDNGTTSKITFDNKNWKIIGEPRAKFFLNRPMYIYEVQEIK